MISLLFTFNKSPWFGTLHFKIWKWQAKNSDPDSIEDSILNSCLMNVSIYWPKLIIRHYRGSWEYTPAKPRRPYETCIAWDSTHLMNIPVQQNFYSSNTFSIFLVVVLSRDCTGYKGPAVRFCTVKMYTHSLATSYSSLADSGHIELPRPLLSSVVFTWNFTPWPWFTLTLS